MDEDSTFHSRRAAWKDNRDLHILELGWFPVLFGLGLVAKEFNQIGLWTFVTF